MTTDRAAQLAAMADEFMDYGGRLPWQRLPAGCTGFRASAWPGPPAEPYEIRFSATWASVTLVCVRSLAGYSPEGGLHKTSRITTTPPTR